MAELTGGASQQDDSAAPAAQSHGHHGGGHGRSHGGGSGGRSFAQDLHSITIHARQRTFYVDLKQSGNGRFFKVSEKSRGGQKTTIMFDAEDLDQFLAAFQEMKGKLA